MAEPAGSADVHSPFDRLIPAAILNAGELHLAIGSIAILNRLLRRDTHGLNTAGIE